MSLVKYSDGGRAAAGMFDSNDCAVRAYAHFTGVTYPVAHGIFAAQGRKVHHGTCIGVIKQEMDKLGAELKVDVTTVGKLVKAYPKGKVYALIRKHAFAVVDGQVLDTVHVGERQRIKGYYVMPGTEKAGRKTKQKSPAGTKDKVRQMYMNMPSTVSDYARAKIIAAELGITAAAAGYYIRSFK